MKSSARTYLKMIALIAFAAVIAGVTVAILQGHLGSSPPKEFRGDGAAVVEIVTRDGAPASGVDWNLVATPPGSGPLAYLAKGTTDADGAIRIEGIATDSRILYQLYHGDTRLALIKFEEEPFVHRTITMPVMPGDRAPDIRVVPHAMEEEVSFLEEHAGKVIFVDFWATWCGPCQQPMQKASDILRRRAADWEGRVVVAAITIDENEADYLAHVEAKGWGNLHHYWARERIDARRTAAEEEYSVLGIPSAFLIRPDGTLALRNHPGAFDMEAEIDRLLAGE